MLSIHAMPFQILLGIAYPLLAATVTVDVLLKKSDVRGALGWIAAAWFSPILGGLLYYLFGINRVTRRALRMRKPKKGHGRRHAAALLKDAPENIRTLFAVSARLTEGPLTGGNDLRVLEGGDTAYPQMLEAIAGAQDSVVLATYIFRGDEAGRRFCDALIAAQARGVTVKVLLDSVGTGYVLGETYYRLKAHGVAVARFLHTLLPWRMPFLNMRNHRKLLVVDGKLAFMGGMNIGAENMASLRPRDFITDIHFRVAGPAVRLLMDAFARDWTFTTGEALDEDRWWPELAPEGPVYAGGLRSGPDADIYKLEMLLGAALSLAKKRVRILTPYFLPDARLQFAITQARLRGVEVDIVIPERCNYLIMDWAMRAHFRFFRHIAANIYTTPLPFDHSKLCTLDDGWCLIGSSNWDARSFRLNFEFDLDCYDPALAGELNGMIDARIARAKKLDVEALIARPVWIRLRDAAARLMMPYL